MKLLFLSSFLLGSGILATASADVNVTDVVDVNTNMDIPEQIIGGDPTEGPVGYQVYLTSEAGYSCGGSLIAPRVVLTAAHCMYDDTGNFAPTSTVKVNLYDFNNDQGSGEILLNPMDNINIIVHPNYDQGTLDNDIALIILPFGVMVDGGYAKLNHDANKPVDGDDLRLTGWGRTSSGGQTSDVLLETEIDYVTNVACQAAYAGVTTITDNMLCAARPGKGICQGDSGGPAMLVNDDVQVEVGIASFVVGCADTDTLHPSVYTRVSRYVDWITENVCTKLTKKESGELCRRKRSKSDKQATGCDDLEAEGETIQASLMKSGGTSPLIGAASGTLALTVALSCFFTFYI